MASHPALLPPAPRVLTTPLLLILLLLLLLLQPLLLLLLLLLKTKLGLLVGLQFLLLRKLRLLGLKLGLLSLLLTCFTVQQLPLAGACALPPFAARRLASSPFLESLAAFWLSASFILEALRRLLFAHASPNRRVGITTLRHSLLCGDLPSSYRLRSPSRTKPRTTSRRGLRVPVDVKNVVYVGVV